MESMDTFMSNETYNYTQNESMLFQAGLNSTRSLLHELTANTSSVRSQKKPHGSLIVPTALSISNQSGIYTEFKMKTNAYIENTLDLNELIRAYQNVCAEHSLFQMSKPSQQSQTSSVLRKPNDEYEILERESHLWHLFNQLYEDDLNSNRIEMMDEINDENSNFVFKNEAKLGKRLTQNNSFLRRIKVIVNWLEYNARDNLGQIKNKISSMPEKCTNWEHTLHQLHSTSSTQQQQQHHTRDFVSELDPDAPIRQHKHLHDLDQEDEYLIMEYIFCYLRAGDLESASKLCMKIGHVWRAATFEGFKLFNDHNYTHLNSDDSNYNNNNNNKLKLNDGNPNRDLWRLVVSKMIDNDSISVYEKAVYGTLAGLTRPVLGVCKTYYDYIWVFFKALYNNLLEKQLRLNMSSRDNERLTLAVDDTIPQTALQIFEEINTLISSNVHLKNESQKPYSILLKKIIISGLDGFKYGTSEILDYLRNVISTDNYANSGPILRFSTHLAQVFRFASFQYKPEAYNNIIENFVQYLIDNKYKDLIAFYLSQVPTDMQTKYYSRFLQNTDERARLIKLARSVNLNVQAITLNIVESLSKTQDDMDLTLPSTSLHNTTANTNANLTFLNKTEFATMRSTQTISEDDKKKIDALDWIVHETAQRVKLLEYSNQIMRYFLLNKQNVDAIKIILGKIPNDTLNMIMSQYKCKTTDDLTEKIRNIIKEYICFKEYTEGINCFNEWFECFNQKPIKQIENESVLINTATTTSLSFSDRITYDYQQKQYDDQLVKWNFKTQQFCDKAKKKFYSLLTFPNGGWMADIKADSLIDDDDDDDDDQMVITCYGNDEMDDEAKKAVKLRLNQMSALRKLYMPYICFVLCEMLSKSNANKELLKLNELIASEKYKLYQLFDKAQLRTLLLKSANASIHLLDTKFDFMGY